MAGPVAKEGKYGVSGSIINAIVTVLVVGFSIPILDNTLRPISIFRNDTFLCKLLPLPCHISIMDATLILWLGHGA